MGGQDERARERVTRSELVRQARQGDRDAYDILLADVVDHLYRIARLILRDLSLIHI